MLRTTAELPFFGLWRDRHVLEALARPEHLTTARYEPMFWRQFGSGHIDLLCESEQQSCVLGAIRLDPIQLVIRERSALIWPAHIAAAVDQAQLLALEAMVLPWLRALSRARPMAQEAVRCFAASGRFDRARDAGLVGAAPLDRSIPRLAPFVYARRFAAGARVSLTCADAALGYALLRNVALAVELTDDGGDDEAFARAWYGVPVTPLDGSGSAADLVIAEHRGAREAPLLIELSVPANCRAPIVDVPAAVPWDLMFSFDGADAPAISHFAVHAIEPPVRAALPFPAGRDFGGSAGTIVIGVGAEALMMRGPDMDEVEILRDRLRAAGFTVHIATEPEDAVVAEAQFLHIFGAQSESHTIAFAEFAVQRGIEFVFDLPPTPTDPGGYLENRLSLLYRAALDEADVGRYLHAYEQGVLELNGGVAEPSTQEYAAAEARFVQLAARAAAILVVAEDLDLLGARFPPAIAGRLSSRGVFAQAEPIAGPIGHRVPDMPFVLVHGAVAPRSHMLYAAVAAERLGIPLVIAGPIFDVWYLAQIRASAPNAIVLADADAQTVSALYRRAHIWVDAAPRPRTVAACVRALACGALPVVAAGSPLTRIIGADAPTFSLKSIDDGARVLAQAMTSADLPDRVAALQARVLDRRDPTSALTGVLQAYARAASATPL